MTVGNFALQMIGTTIAIVPSAPPKVQIAVPDRIELREKVQFAKDSARILEVSHAVLDEAVAEIQAHPTIRKIRVEGHASADGNDAHNLDLSARRAASVREYLVSKGVPADLLVAEGFGETRPIADNETSEGREANRRVELHVVEVEGAGRLLGVVALVEEEANGVGECFGDPFFAGARGADCGQDRTHNARAPKGHELAVVVANVGNAGHGNVLGSATSDART
jgi:hypothetical protein